MDVFILSRSLNKNGRVTHTRFFKDFPDSIEIDGQENILIEKKKISRFDE